MDDPTRQAAVAALLREIAVYLRLEREPYRARAYDRAADVVAAAHDFEGLLRAGRLRDLPGIGASLASAIEELAATGNLSLLERLRSRWPRGLVALLGVPGLGWRKARQLHDALGIQDLAGLEEACRTGRVRTVPGFGERTERALLAALARPQPPPRPAVLRLVSARPLAAQLAAYARAGPGVVAAEAAGGVRRWQETVDGIDLALAARAPEEAVAHLARHPLVSVLAPAGTELARGTLVSGVPLALHAGPPERYGAVLARATGSAAHWEALRARAAARGLALDALAAPDEPSLYAALGLPWLPPEVRDGSDELAAADAGALDAALVDRADVRGAVHCHTTYSDGSASIEEMARAAQALGLEYLTITDHSQSAGYARGVTLDRLRKQWDEIDEVQARTPVRLLKGTEADILADGALDWPDAVLERLDVVIASIHQRYKQDEEQMTRRLLRAMRLPFFKIWGHALGRILLRRDPIACRLDEVLDAVAASPAAIELNGDPYRLDLPPELARGARARGIRFVLSSDAHSTGGIRALEYAVHMARRARLTRADVLNCLPAAAFAAAVRPAGAGRGARPAAARRTAPTP